MTNIFGIPVVVNKWLPKGTILLVGDTCRYCGAKLPSFLPCYRDGDPTKPTYLGHVPQARIINIAEEDNVKP